MSECSLSAADILKHASIQESSTKLLNFYVADLLCLSQIKNKKFRKQVTSFDVRSAIDEIVEVQRDKLDFN